MNDSMPSDDDISDINKIVQEAKELYEKLIEDEETANQLLCKANLLNNTAVTMVEYQEIIEKLDEETNGGPDSSQIPSIVTESRQLHQLQNENAQLKMALEDHQFALELIMSKYRQQVCRYLNHHRSQKVPTIKSSCDSETVSKLSARIKDMAQVMMDSIEIDEENKMRRDKTISQLKMENETLRELVSIAIQFQSIKKEDVPSDILTGLVFPPRKILTREPCEREPCEREPNEEEAYEEPSEPRMHRNKRQHKATNSLGKRSLQLKSKVKG